MTSMTSCWLCSKVVNNISQIFFSLLAIVCVCVSGAAPGFQVRGAHTEKIPPSGGRRENFWGISCEKSRFYAKQSNFRGGGARRVRPPWIRPCVCPLFEALLGYFFNSIERRKQTRCPRIRIIRIKHCVFMKLCLWVSCRSLYIDNFLKNSV